MDNLFPLNDKSSKTFDELFSRLNTLDTDKLLVYLIDSTESSALPHLAQQFHVMGNEGWLFTSSEQEKRNLIKNAIELHKFKGTKYSLKKVLEILKLNGKIKEWFEYEGSPYHFIISLDLKNRSYEPSVEIKLLDLIEETKNVRSIMQKLEVNLANQADYKLRTAIITSEEITI